MHPGGFKTITGLIDRYPLFRQIFRDGPVAMGILSAADGVYIDANEALTAILGYSRGELRGHPITSIRAGLDLDARMILNALHEYREIGGIPVTITSRDRIDHTCVLSLQLEELDGEEYVFFILQEFVNQKKAWTALLHFESRFQLFYQSVPLPLLVVDDESARIVDVNPAATTLYGYSRAEFLGLSLSNLLPEGGDNGDGVAGALPGAARETGSSEITCHRLKDGRLIDVHISSYSFLLDDRPATLSIVQDVTEQRAVQAELEASEERQRIIADMTADAIRDHDMLTGKAGWNAGLHDLFGYDVEEPIDQAWWSEMIHPHDREAILTSLDSTLASGAGDWIGGYRFRRADGTYAGVLDSAYIMRDENGRATRLLGSMVDITKQLELADVAANAALEERQRLAQTLHESVSQSLYSISLLAEASRRRALAGEQQAVTDYVARLGELTIQTLRQMRLLLYDLRPGVLEQEGLSEALRHRLEAVEHRAGIKARLIDLTLLPIPPALQRELFWIAQEVLNNSLRHASATIVGVTLSTEEDEIVLTISDNGRGFDPTARDDDGGLGAIERRIDELRGTLAVDSHADRGTVLTIRIPGVAT